MPRFGQCWFGITTGISRWYVLCVCLGGLAVGGWCCWISPDRKPVTTVTTSAVQGTKTHQISTELFFFFPFCCPTSDPASSVPAELSLVEKVVP